MLTADGRRHGGPGDNPDAGMASEVVRIDVVADPDRVVPDPLRDNNVLSWQGNMRPLPDCSVDR